MQTAQIKEKLMNIEQCVDNAALICQSSNATPEILRNCLDQLEKESDQVQQIVDETDDEQQIRQCIDRLEELGDRTIQACRQAGNVDPKMQNAIAQAHEAISSLKHQLH